MPSIQRWKRIGPFWPKALRQRAIRRCEEFVTERLNGEDGLGAIYPAMANSVMMYDALGYAPDHPDRATARGSIDRLLVIRDDEAYCQPCVSPIWDTALVAHALMEADSSAAGEGIASLCEWLKTRQVLDVKGDWAHVRPDVRPGGWAFQYKNAHYPDLDDTAVVVMALDRAVRAGQTNETYADTIARGREWVEGLQSRNGGWGAFDADNTHYYLNNIPFADHGALLDPPTADVTARCIGMMAQLGEPATNPRLKAAVDYLVSIQEKDGSWFGRWGVNYIYGTWSALAGLNAAGLDPDAPPVRRAAEWLISIQNPDGGWGESCDSYRLDYGGYERAPSILSFADGLGASGAYGRRGNQKRGGRKRYSLVARTPAKPGTLERGELYGRGLPARVLLAVSWLCEVFPVVGGGAIPQPSGWALQSRRRTESG